MMRGLFSQTFDDAESLARQYRQENKGVDWRTVFLCVYVGFALTMIRYIGDFHYFLTFLKSIGLDWLATRTGTLYGHSGNQKLFGLAFWIMVNILFYMLLPLVIIKLWRQRGSDYGLSLKNTSKDFRIFLWIFFIMVPLVIFFSTTQGFQQRYPFYDPPKGESLFPYFFIWEALYFLQFVGLEFFFRGFIVHGLKYRLGYYAVPVMTIPYCMIHYNKPLPETLAAIVAGMVLGTLSLRSRSIWWGVAIHYSVALGMDIAALWQKGYF